MGTKISLCMMVKNEELLIENGLKRAAPYVDEIIVVDTGSTDRTVAIAKKYGAKIIHHKWDGYSGRARNAYLRRALGDWILALDGDECIATKDMVKIRNLIKDPVVSAYYFYLRDYHKNYNLLSNWHPNDGSYPQEEKFSRCPGWATSKLVRLFRRSDVLSYDENAITTHVSFKYMNFKKKSIKIKNTDVALHHFQYLKGADSYIAWKWKRRLAQELRHIKKFPYDVHVCVNVAKSFFSLGKDTLAIQLLKRILHRCPSSEAHFVLGMIYKEKKKLNLAEWHLQKAVRLSEMPTDPLTVLGMVYTLQNKFLLARDVLQRALKMHPKHLLGINALGILREKMGFLKSAERCFKQAVGIHPEFGEAYFNLGLLYKTQCRMRKARQCFLKVLRINPRDTEARNQIHVS